jgi:hypothetical protein
MRIVLIAVLIAAAGTRAAAQSSTTPYAPAEITTTGPSSTTSPGPTSPAPVPLSPTVPRAHHEGDQPRGPQAQSIANPTGPPSITRPNVPSVVPPDSNALCYQHEVFNPNTYEYEWRESCD